MNLKAIGFASQLDDDEIVIDTFRRPFSSTGSKLLMWLIIFSVIGYGIWSYVSLILPGMPIDSRWLILVPIIFGVERVLVVFWKWYGNAVLMTSESLVFTSWEGFFDRKITRLDYWDLDDVGMERKGIGMFISGVADVVFEKVGGGEPHIYLGMNRPKRAVKILRNHRAKMLDEKNFTEESALKKLLSQLVQTQVRSDGQPPRDMGETLAALKNASNQAPKSSPESLDNEAQEVDFELDDEGGIEIRLED